MGPHLPACSGHSTAALGRPEIGLAATRQQKRHSTPADLTWQKAGPRSASSKRKFVSTGGPSPGPASLTERQAFVQAEAHNSKPSDDLVIAYGQSKRPDNSSAVTERVARAWTSLRSDSWDGFCGKGRDRQRDRRNAAQELGDVDVSTAATYRVGLAWGAGLELRNSPHMNDEPSAALKHDLFAPQQAFEETRQRELRSRPQESDVYRNDGSGDARRPVERDAYAWRDGARRGEVRLLSDVQLLDFEGGLTSFSLGGHRQRFDLSSLKERWIDHPQHLQERGADAAWAAEKRPPEEAARAPHARVHPLASLKRKHDEPLAPRDDRISMHVGLSKDSLGGDVRGPNKTWVNSEDEGGC